MKLTCQIAWEFWKSTKSLPISKIFFLVEPSLDIEWNLLIPSSSRFEDDNYSLCSDSEISEMSSPDQ